MSYLKRVVSSFFQFVSAPLRESKLERRCEFIPAPPTTARRNRILVSDALDAQRVVERQLRFLLQQAPLMDAPASLARAGCAVTKYAYVHPKTFAKFTANGAAAHSGRTVALPYFRIAPSRTKWVVTTLMPEGGVIYTPNPLPGIENWLENAG